MIETSDNVKFNFYNMTTNAILKKIRYFRLARHAFLAALKVINIQPSDKIVVPAFVCRDLLAPIHKIGATPIFYEVDSDLKPISLPEASNIRAVLAVNYFGFPQDLSQFYAYCERNNASLIEDNAHGFLSCDEAGVELGTRGDLGIFSIRKTFPLPDGAMLIVNKSGLQKNIDPQLTCSERSLGLSFFGKRVLSGLQRKTNIPFFTIGTSIARSIRLRLTGYEITPLLPENEFKMPENPAPHSYSISKLLKLDLVHEINRRRSLFIVFSDLFATLDVKPVFRDLPMGTVPYGYPFYADESLAKIAVGLARKQGFDCIHWPDLPETVVPRAPWHYRSLWMVNFTC
jgi:hypothetical protein